MSFQPFNLAQAYGAAEQIKGSRQRNALMQRQADMQEQQFSQQNSLLEKQNAKESLLFMGKLAQAALQTDNPAEAFRAAVPDIQRFAGPEYRDLAGKFGPNLEGLDDQTAAGLSEYVLRSAPFQQAPSESYRPLNAQEASQFGLEGTGYQINEQTNKISKIGGAGTTIQMPGQQKAEDSEYGKWLVKNFADIQESANKASEERAQWEMMRAFEVPTGSGEEAKLFFRDHAAKIANAMGFQVSDDLIGKVSDAKSYKALTQDLLRQRLANQKGPQTEGDAIRMRQTLAQIENPAEANQFIQAANLAMIDRKEEQAAFYRDWRAEKGTLEGADRAWSEFKKTTPLVAKNPNTKKPVFYNQFTEAFLMANPDATYEDALKVWRQKYAR